MCFLLKSVKKILFNINLSPLFPDPPYLLIQCQCLTWLWWWQPRPKSNLKWRLLQHSTTVDRQELTTPHGKPTGEGIHKLRNTFLEDFWPPLPWIWPLWPTPYACKPPMTSRRYTVEANLIQGLDSKEKDWFKKQEWLTSLAICGKGGTDRHIISQFLSD